ncbi:Do family serine endopeptidase [Stappia sp. 28M-7]|jgi:serine protease Do|uniref:Do family serine endopeptidase n=1 Tax=Stappia sp. 28M-7 TaxID=2762596 RepID=UPI000E7269FC|nr:Do family serine endopeptidase [Stappia sp. 28M-7]MBC2858871.1 Do family serine endopeptidase [Stappia sp. 28M-7]
MSNKYIPSALRRLPRGRTSLAAGALALGLAGAMSLQTVVPGQFAFADPVRVESAAPQNFASVVSAVKPAVVSVRVRTDETPKMMSNRQGVPGFEDLPQDHPLQRFFRRFGGEQFGGDQRRERQPRRHGMSQGSGFFITGDGYLVTNEHVVSNGSEFTVIMDDGQEYEAKLIGADKRTDLALLKVDGEGREFTYVEFAPEAPQVGEWVVAVGNPFGLGGSVTAGIVSARGRDIGAGPYDDFIQIDAPVNRGNSGGPAFNVKGQVIGVNAAIFSPSGGNVGIAFAIPASTATAIVKDLRDDGTVVRGWLGVQIQPVSKDIAESVGLKDAKGAIVADAQGDSPARKAGIRSGDTILSVDGQTIDGPRDLARMIAAYPPETEVTLDVWRDGREEEVKVILGRLQDDGPVTAAVEPTGKDTAFVDSLGVELAAASVVGAGERGVVITEVPSDSAAAEKGLQRGDVILEVAGQAVNNPGEVANAVQGASENGRKSVLLRVERNDASRFVAVPVEQNKG